MPHVCFLDIYKEAISSFLIYLHGRLLKTGCEDNSGVPTVGKLPVLICDFRQVINVRAITHSV